MIFKVLCEEEVSVNFLVEAPGQASLDAWLEEHGADAVSTLLEGQTVNSREFSAVAVPDSDEAPDYNVAAGGKAQ